MTIGQETTSVPLTQAQLRIWSGQQIVPDAPLYNMAFAFRISGPVNPDAFESAFNALVAETDALRMVVIEAGSLPSQRARAAGPVLEHVTLTSENALEAVLAERDAMMFDLTRQSCASLLIRLGPTQWVWYFNQHHIFNDAASTSVLFARMQSLYMAQDGDPLPSFAAYAVNSADGAEPQQDAAEEHFSTRTGNPLRLYGRRAAHRNSASKRVDVPLTAQQRDAFMARSREGPWASFSQELSQFNMLATIYAAFLYRISAEDTVRFAAPVHNRTRAIERNMAGLLIDVLPMGVEIAESETFTSLFAKIRTESGLLLRHAKGAVHSNTGQGSNAVLNFITARMDRFAGMPVAVQWRHPGHVDPAHHIRLQAFDWAGSGDVQLCLDLNKDIIARPDDAAAHFASLFNAFLIDPDQPINAVPIVTAAERTRLTQWGDGGAAAGNSPMIQDVIAQQCAQRPGTAALVFGASQITYGQMNTRILGLTEQLQHCGVGPGDFVAIALPRCPAAVISMLAVMRSGAAYLPLDPALPAARRQFILNDCGAKVVIGLDETFGPAIVVDELAEKVMPPAQPSAAFKGDSGDAAYLLYTSGSTGQPKGVLVPHRGLSHYLHWAYDRYGASAPLSSALFTPLSFDLSVTSIYLPLMSGGTLNIYPDTPSGPDFAVLDALADDAADFIKLTPSHLRMVSGHTVKTKRLRQIIIGGEDLPVALAKGVHDQFGGNVALHNEYGPTEASVGCIVHRFDPQKDRQGSVPIGRPIRNMDASIVNNHGQLQPQGVPGELWLRGAGLADGYLHRDDLTKAAFTGATDNPGRAYRTQDIARFQSDGDIAYLGRADAQVKVNGVRIELSEIEAVLMSAPGVNAACANLREHAPETQSVLNCTKCGIASNVPDVVIGADGICSICEGFEQYRGRAQSYFHDYSRLRPRLARRLPSQGSHDCLVLFSGGKDSTYMLGRLVDMGLNVLAFTLDNGFLSDQAKANIARVVNALGIDHIYETAPGMNDIFADSLARFSNVCNGCFKAIYTLGMSAADARQIPFMVTGLSRGQFFETRLSPDLFAAGAPAAEEIDEMVLAARKVYHRTQDTVTRCLDTAAFDDDALFERVEVVDFYRYCDVALDALYAYLDERLPWVRPSDTGRSTNCRINDVGIYVHKLEQGYHNYALPYSWDVRMGHKQRASALAELDDNIDDVAVHDMLAEIGYHPQPRRAPAPELIGYYTSNVALSHTALRSHLAKTLPSYMIPARFVHLDAMPLSQNGKINRRALPDPPQRSADAAQPPRTPEETRMAAIWAEVLGLEAVGAFENLFDLGGDSITALRIVARAPGRVRATAQ